jgi:hypothetical protein
MAELSAVYTLTTPGPDITFNSGSDLYWLSEITGLDMAPVRAPIDNSPQTDGGIVHDFFYGPRHVVFRGLLVPGTNTPTNRNTMENNLISALESILRADGTLSWTPTGGSARSLTVRCDVPAQFSGGLSLSPREFIFGMIAADPTW